MSANTVWINNLNKVMREGSLVQPRGMVVREVLNNTSIVDMIRPVVTVIDREMGYRFMAAEAHWILSGDDRVETIAPYAKHISSFSDDGIVFQGAYGPRVVSQLNFVTKTLARDRDSRQAVMTIWRPSPGPSKDIPCTISLQFFIRDGCIHTIANMRSSDLWLGWVYDVFNFTMITAYVALMLKQMGITYIDDEPSEKNYDLGYLYLNAGSQHIYDRNFAKVDYIQKQGGLAWQYKPFRVSDFESPESLMSHLVALRDRDWPNVKHLHELEQHLASTA